MNAHSGNWFYLFEQFHFLRMVMEDTCDLTQSPPYNVAFTSTCYFAYFIQRLQILLA